MKIKKEQLPSGGRMYFSEEPISELFLIIDEVIQADPVRCDCDSRNRCWNHRLESFVFSLNGKLKERISQVFEDDKIADKTDSNSHGSIHHSREMQSRVDGSGKVELQTPALTPGGASDDKPSYKTGSTEEKK